MNPNSLLSPLSTLFFHTVEIFTSYPHKSSSSNPLTSPGSTLAVAFLVALPSSQRGPFSPSLPHRDSLSSAPPFLHAQQPTTQTRGLGPMEAVVGRKKETGYLHVVVDVVFCSEEMLSITLSGGTDGMGSGGREL
ncbi:hypothetical protein HN51_045426 [Arachis hypogaea]